MKNKKGFTLVELLAVIAILAILVIIALPNVLQMFRNAKENTFANEVQNLVRSAEDKYLTSSLSSGNNTCFDSKTNPLDMTGRDNINYLIKLSNKGKVIELNVIDDSYQLLINNENGINKADIGNKYQVEARNKTTDIFDCNNSFLVQGEEGTGEEDTPYKIQYIDDLVELSKNVEAGETYAGKTFVLSRNIDFKNKDSYKDGENSEIYTQVTTGTGFTPIGVGSNCFKGNFDGKNHRIDNLYIKNTDESGIQLGLFGKIENSIITNLTVSGSIENGTNPLNAGMISNVRGTSKIINCINEIKISSESTGHSLGGIVATLETGGNLTIENCVNKGQVSGGMHIGGLMGGVAQNANLTIKNSENLGIISTGSQNIGGLIGFLDKNSTAIIEKSYNNAEIKFNSNEDKDVYMGGLIGYAIDGSTIDITNSGNNANITNLHTDYSVRKVMQVGGLIGYSFSSKSLKIDGSYNKGNLYDGALFGGVIGHVRNCDKAIINNTYNKGNLTEANIINSTVEVDIQSGPFVGYNYGSNLYILNSYNTGNMDKYKSYPSGLVGFNIDNARTSIFNSFNLGNGIVDGITYDANNTNFKANSYTINNVYNAGNISRYGIGNLGTSNTINIKNTYYKNDTIKNGTNLSNDSDLTIGKSESEMKNQSFVTLLNSNKNNINLTEIDSGLSGYTLCDWKLGTSGYPELDCK